MERLGVLPDLKLLLVAGTLGQIQEELGLRAQ